MADDTAKLSGRDHEFREPTPRREQPVRSESLSGDSQGDAEQSHPTETTDDGEPAEIFGLFRVTSSIVIKK